MQRRDFLKTITWGGLAGGLDWGRCLAGTAACPGTASADDCRVIVRTDFDDGTVPFAHDGYRLVENMKHQGRCALMAEAVQPGDTASFEIPFQVAAHRKLRVSFWVRAEARRAAVGVWIERPGREREFIGGDYALVGGEWRQITCLWPALEATAGVVRVQTPWPWGTPPGKVWLDEIKIIDMPDDCPWPSAVVYHHPVLAGDRAGTLWQADAQQQQGGPRLVISRGQGPTEAFVAQLADTDITGIDGPAIATLERGCVVACAVERDDRWRINYAFVNEPTDPIRWHAVEGPGLVHDQPALAVAQNDVHLVYRSSAGPCRRIWACCLGPAGADTPVAVSDERANAYHPAVVALGNGRVFAAWDSRRDQDWNLYGAWLQGGGWQRPRQLTHDRRIERHAALAAHGNQLWLAWQAQSYERHKINDTTEQRIVVARLTRQGLRCPRRLFQDVSPPDRLLLRPQLAFDARGGLWLSARQSLHTNAGWTPVVWHYDGVRWSDPQAVTEQQGRYLPVSLAASPEGMWAAAQFDSLPRFWEQQGIVPLAWRYGVKHRRFDRAPAAATQVEPLSMPPTDFDLAAKRSWCGADLVRPRVDHQGKQLHLYWGDLHDHTDLSVCRRSMNPPGEDVFAHEREIEGLDFCALTDHGFNFDRPQWAFNAAQTRRHHDPDRFVTFLAQEWTSSGQPAAEPGEPERYGHHNLIFLDPYFDSFYDAFDRGESPTELWRTLAAAGCEFICIPHQLADWQHKGGGNPPKDWRHHDEYHQPVAEIWQERGSYEHLGCPRQASFGAPFQGHYLQDAWQRGLVIGVIASPDHGGGSGKLGVWAPTLDRRAVFDALRARHTFGTSGPRISLLLRCGGALMGDKVARPDGPLAFEITAAATEPIQEIVILRNNELVHRCPGGQPNITAAWTDYDIPAAPRLWYYVRVHLAHDELAWSSPIWFMGDTHQGRCLFHQRRRPT